jgi:hypothetical protein
MRALATHATALPGRMSALVAAQLGPEEQQLLQAYCAAAGVSMV